MNVDIRTIFFTRLSNVLLFMKWQNFKNKQLYVRKNFPLSSLENWVGYEPALLLPTHRLQMWWMEQENHSPNTSMKKRFHARLTGLTWSNEFCGTKLSHYRLMAKFFLLRSLWDDRSHWLKTETLFCHKSHFWRFHVPTRSLCPIFCQSRNYFFDICILYTTAANAKIQRH